jgi:hypothetical protein
VYKRQDINGPYDINEVYADLTSLGGSQNQRMYDDGTNGDQTKEDGVYTYTLRKQSFPLGEKTVAIFARDNKRAEVQTSIGIEVKDAKEFSEPSTILRAGVTPFKVPNDGYTTATLWAIVQDPEDDIDSVVADLTPIGGEKKAQLGDNGVAGDLVADDGNYSIQFQVSPMTPLGKATIRLTAEDDIGHLTTSEVALNVVLPPIDPEIISGQVEPDEVPNDGTTQCLLTVAASDQNDDIVSVVVDLSKVGGDDAVVMNDNGINGDKVTGDGIWSVRFTVPSTVPSGSKDVTVTATDSTQRIASSKVSFRVFQANMPPAIEDYQTGLTGGRARIGDVIIMKVNASDPEGRISRVEADLTELSLGLITLLDNGEGDDEIAGDGTYTGSIKPVSYTHLTLPTTPYV